MSRYFEKLTKISSCCRPVDSNEICDDNCDNKPKLCSKIPIIKIHKPKGINRSKSDLDILVPYTFRLPFRLGPKAQKIGVTPVKSPPFHILLDHTLAVLWCHFSKNKKLRHSLGIGQLQWALYFLKALKQNNGEYYPDVAIAISSIEEYLIQCYASLSCIVMRPLRSPCMTCSIDVPVSTCGVCTSMTLGPEPRRSIRSMLHITPPKFTSTPQPPNQSIQHLSFLTQKHHQSSKFETNDSLKHDIHKLKAIIAAMSKNESSECASDTMIDLIQECHKEKLKKIKEDLNKYKKMEKVFGDESSGYGSYRVQVHKPVN